MTASQPTDMTLPRLLAQRVAAAPEAIAFQARDADGHWRPLSWQNFAEQVQQLRKGLAAAGLRHGDRLALIAPVSLRWELVHHAAVSLGAVVVGLDAHDLPQRIANMAEQADIAAFVVADTAVLGQVGERRLASARFVLHLGAADASPLDPARQLDWPALTRLSEAAPAGGGNDAVAPKDLATIIFTSGTTGAPRGIAYSHGQICLAVQAICEAFSFVGSSSRLLCWLPLSNLFQRIVNLAAVRQGATTYLLGNPRQVMQVVGEVAPDIFVGVPRFFEKLYEGVRDGIDGQPPLKRWLALRAWALGRRMSRCTLQQRVPPLGLRLAHAAAERLVLRRIRSIMGSRLRVLVTGSAPTPRPLLEDLHALGWLVLEAYGLSENVIPMALNRADDFRFGTVGRPVAPNEIVVAENGAVKVRGPGLFRGYLGGGSQLALDQEGFYTTGDLGEWDEDGYLRLVGRAGDLFKTSTGRLIAPVGVEAELRRVPGIDQVVVIGAGRKCPIALCTVAAGGLGASARHRLTDALAACVARISEHERPCGIALLDRPFSIEQGELTPNLKLRRAAIEALHAAPIDELYRRLDERPNVAAPLLVV